MSSTVKCIWCEIARRLGGKYCRPCWRKLFHIKDKSYNISDMIYTGIRLETIVSEIEKCEVRCANCHRRKKAKQSNCFRFQKSMGL